MLRVTLEPDEGRVLPGEAAVTATFVNVGNEPAPFHEHLASHASLLLQVEAPDGHRLLMLPPSMPDERDLAPPRPLAPGEAVTLRYTALLDCRVRSGAYRVRVYTTEPAFGGSVERPLESDWVPVDVIGPDVAQRHSRFWRPIFAVGSVLERVRQWAWLSILRLLCRAVLEREVDVPITEVISNATVTSWNGTYAWNARFHLRVDQPAREIVVTLRLRVFGSAGAGWQAAIEGAWNNRFKSCVDLGCAPNGYPIRLRLLWVTSGEHQQVNAGAYTANMNNWGTGDTFNVPHEVGHMLGNKEEYYTVDGIAYGEPHQKSGNIMNNPANPPVAAHYRLVQRYVDLLLGQFSEYATLPVTTPCP